ncbi:hypothetical protein BGZ60DRAFT_414266 [Tricladium varicosporioides]|nr:hypothetical protein BGZ60DRAFT_414266 [Hymenoscyphus varicosporioides]
MPGVPSGRGCEACRKQKKKCDQVKPKCTRCKRLDIDCIGGGQQRYKFKEQNVIIAKSAKSQSAPKSVHPVCTGLLLQPSNETALVVSGFISKLEVTDLRYDLTYYGDFLKDVPKRLGNNEALDASASALTCAYQSVYTRQQTPEMLDKYVHALTTLRRYLKDPTKAYAANTLCAIYLVEVCQSWLGKRDDYLICHGEVIAHILNTAPLETWRHNFELEMLITISAPVVLESFINPRINLTPFFSKLAEVHAIQHGPSQLAGIYDNAPIESIKLRSLARIGVYFRDPELHLPEITSAYQELRADSTVMRHRLSEWDKITKLSLANNTPLQSYPIIKLHTHHQAAYGIVISLVLLLGSILNVFYPSDLALAEDLITFSDYVLGLAENAKKYRPVGSGYMPFCLVTAWAATDGTTKQIDVEKMIGDWQSDMPEARWLDMANWLKGNTESLRLRWAISQLEISSDNFYDTGSAVETEKLHPADPMSSCVIL